MVEEQDQHRLLVAMEETNTLLRMLVTMTAFGSGLPNPFKGSEEASVEEPQCSGFDPARLLA